MDLSSESTGATAEWPGAASHQQLEDGARPLVPGADPFYQPPSGFEDAAPGTVLRTRDVQLAFWV